MRRELQTTDLFLSAYLLNEKQEIRDVQLDPRFKKKIIFIFPSNSEIEALKNEYKQGFAKANLLEFKKNYQHVQSLFYEAKRQFDLF